MKAMDSSTYDMRYGSLYIAALISFSTIATADTVHRWKDENGVINYGHMPPAGCGVGAHRILECGCICVGPRRIIHH